MRDRHQQPDVRDGDHQLGAILLVEPVDPVEQLPGGFVGDPVRRQHLQRILGGRQHQLDPLSRL